MATVSFRSKKGATLMSKMFPDPLDYAARLMKLGYCHPTWWNAYKAAPPKAIYQFDKISKSVLPIDDMVKSCFKKIPMLKKEKFDIFDPEFSPLAVKICVTQKRLMEEEGLTEEAAFEKCEHEIYKEELYYFGKMIRENPGNYFKLTDNEMNHFYVHDIINEIHHLKTQMKSGAPARIAAKEYINTPEPTLQEAQAKRGFKPVIPRFFYHPYSKTGVKEKPLFKAQLFEDSSIDIEAASARLFPYYLTETQRYIKSDVQVPARILIKSMYFGNTPRPTPRPEEDYLSPYLFNAKMLQDPEGEEHLAINDKEYFMHSEILEQKEKLEQLKIEDQQIIELLNLEKKAKADAANAANAAESA